MWNSLLQEIVEVKSTNGLRKALNTLTERSVIHPDYCSLVTQVSPHASICDQKRLTFLLHFLAFTAGHCQSQGLRLDGHLLWVTLAVFTLQLSSVEDLEHNITNNITVYFILSSNTRPEQNASMYVKCLQFFQVDLRSNSNVTICTYRRTSKPWRDSYWWNLLSLAYLTILL